MPRLRRVLLSLLALAGLAAGCSAPSSQRPPESGTFTGSASSPIVPPTPSAGQETDPWLLTMDGMGPYRLGARLESMPAGLFGDSHAYDPAKCPGLYGRSARGQYVGVAQPVVRDGVLIEVSSSDARVHTPAGDRVGDPWATIESRYAGSPSPGGWRTSPSGTRAFVVPRGERVLIFYIYPLQPDGVGSISVGLTDFSLRRFLTGEDC